MENNGEILLDIIIPVYNEGRNILRTLDSLCLHVKTPFRLHICYDYENDNTLPVIRDCKRYPDISFVKNRGKGVHGAIVTGFEVSRAPAVLVFPADDDYNAAIVDKMYALFGEGCDIVAASRFMKGGSMEGCPWIKSVFVRSASFTLNKFAFIPIKDASNGFRLFSRRAIKEVLLESSEGFTYSIELLVKCHRLGWKIGEVPAKWYERTQGKSRFKVFGWLPYYLKWYFYGFKTTYLKKYACKVKMTGAGDKSEARTL
ncbi:MAG TPA: glycosyl transferase family 2 [Elusimicrobia bacterium]|nr:glycosyl transferase family 2 [Elusimicrobiota bacterium]